MNHSTQKGAATAAVALVIAIIALVVSLVAYRAAKNVDLTDEANRQANAAVEETKQGFARLQAAARLNALRADQATLSDEQFAARLRNIRTDLGSAYANATGEAKQEWQQWDGRFENAETQARGGARNALSALQGLVAGLTGDVPAGATTTATTTVR